MPKPINNADINMVEMRDDGNIGRKTPHCKTHGAMNMLTKDGIWRCLSMYAWIPTEYQTTSKDKKKRNDPPDKLNERTCPAGCEWLPTEIE